MPSLRLPMRSRLTIIAPTMTLHFLAVFPAPARPGPPTAARPTWSESARRIALHAVRFVSLVVALGHAAPLANADAPAATVSTSDSVPSLILRHEADRSDLRRFLAIPVAPARHDRVLALAEEWRSLIDAVDFDALDLEARIDWILFRNNLDRERSQLQFERDRLAEIAPLIPFAQPIITLETARWRMEPIDSQSAASALVHLRVQVETLRQRITAAVDAAQGDAPDPVLALRAAAAVESLRNALERWFAFHDGFKPEFSWWTRRPQEELVQSLRAYETLLRERVAGQRGAPEDPLVGAPIGESMLLAELRHEFIPYTPEELIAIAEREMAWCARQMDEAAARMGLTDRRAALAAVKERHARPGEQDALVAQFAQEAIDFVDERGLVTVPPLARETWRLEMLSAERQRTLPFAAYGGQHMLVAYPTDEMDHLRKVESMRGNNRHFTRIVTAHELIPGHHLQGFVAARENIHRRPFRTPFLVEGWALHWEMLLWDLGFAGGPEDELGMLFWRMHRCARIIVSLRYHLGQMQPPEMIDYLVEQVGLERDGATAEVRRYIGDAYGPLYQVAYMIGGLQMRALHRELVGAGRMSQREFHDAVLRRNSIPIELIRASLLGAAPTRDMASSWRFDEAFGGNAADEPSADSPP